MKIPSECPVCHNISIEISKIAPENHDKGDEWLTRADCGRCAYAKWFEAEKRPIHQ